MLPAYGNNAVHESCITIIDGESLAKIYKRYSDRLFQQNVRVFLQTKGPVNKGIKATLEEKPEMFFSFNNGITCTASEITQHNGEIVSIKDFQIVNGAQTTVSIYKAFTANKCKLPDVYVQMKLSVVRKESGQDISDVVSDISRYSNTQNKVHLPDLSANHPYHKMVEDFSRTVSMPRKVGDLNRYGPKWFYERARGQYHSKRAEKEKPAEKKIFDNDYKSRRFTKQDLGLVMEMWEPGPDDKSNATQVNQGGVKNYQAFQDRIKKEFKTDESSFDLGYYREVIAKLIISRRLSRLLACEFNIRGHKNRFVNHAIGKLASDLRKEKKAFNFEKVWRLQDLTPGLKQYASKIIPEIRNIIFNPPEATQDRDTWAKTQQCTDKVEALEIKFPEALYDELEDIIISGGKPFTITYKYGESAHESHKKAYEKLPMKFTSAYGVVKDGTKSEPDKSEEKPEKNLENDRENSDIKSFAQIYAQDEASENEVILEQIMEFQGKGSKANKYVLEQRKEFWRSFFDYAYENDLLAESVRSLLVKVLSNSELRFNEGERIIHYVNELYGGFKQELEDQKK